MNVRGIGEGKYADIRNLITCSGGSGSYYHPPTPPPSNTDPYASSGGTDPYASTGSSGKLNINIATQAELESLPGVGPAKARAIIDYRSRYGKFQRKEDVRNVPGIGDAIYSQIAAYIVAVGGATTSSEVSLARDRYQKAYQKFTSMQNDPYSTYAEQRQAYDEYLAAKKEYDCLVAKY